MSSFSDIGAVTAQRVWEGVVARSIHGERITMAVVELGPNAVVSRHQHPQEQLGIVIEGTVTFTVGDETRNLVPGETWRILGDTPHEVVAGPDGAVVIDVFSPVRDDWHALEAAEGSPRWPLIDRERPAP